MRNEFAHLVRYIEIKNRKKIRSLKAGLFSSQQKGQGTDFRDVRKYYPGDDTRFIDWNVTSRMNELFVREYYEEQELNVNVFFDVSSSMNLSGLLPASKYYYALQFALLLSLVFSGTGDRIRLILYSDSMVYASPVLKTKASVFAELGRILQNPYQGKTDHLLPLRLLRERFSKRSLSYIISDFSGVGDISSYSGLQKAHDIYAIRILDGSETLPQTFLNNFYLASREGSGGEKRISSFVEDGKNLKNFYRNRFLDLQPGETGSGSIVRFFNES